MTGVEWLFASLLGCCVLLLGKIISQLSTMERHLAWIKSHTGSLRHLGDEEAFRKFKDDAIAKWEGKR